MPDGIGARRRQPYSVGFPLRDHPFSRATAIVTDEDVPPFTPIRLRFIVASFLAPLRSRLPCSSTVACANNCLRISALLAMRKIAPIRLRARRQPPRIRRQFNVCGFSFRPAGREKHWRGRYTHQAVGRAKRQSEALARVGRRSFLQ